VQHVVGGVTRYSVYDASGALIEIDQVSGPKTDYIRASGMTLARIAGSTITWLHHDHLGSAVAGTNSVGTVIWRESEQPFGEDWTTAAANDNQAGYTGHVEDAATGLTYMQARYYDPVIGRFLSIDPVGFSPTRPSMFNRYAYASNDPVNAIDRDGRDPLFVLKTLCSAVTCTVGVNVDNYLRVGNQGSAGIYMGPNESGQVVIGVYGNSGVGVGNDIGVTASATVLFGTVENLNGIADEVEISGNAIVPVGPVPVPVTAGITTGITQEGGVSDAPKADGVPFVSIDGGIGAPTSGPVPVSGHIARTVGGSAPVVTLPGKSTPAPGPTKSVTPAATSVGAPPKCVKTGSRLKQSC